MVSVSDDCTTKIWMGIWIDKTEVMVWEVKYSL